MDNKFSKEKVNNKEKILRAVLELASQKGLGAVSLSQIAAKVGIQKSTLYSHFSSKDEIITSLYEYLRENAKRMLDFETVDYGDFVKGKKAEDILYEVINNYIKMNQNSDISMFYKFIVSERVFNTQAAKIMVMESQKMIVASKQLFYAMQIHGIMTFENIDIAALTFAMTVHSLIDYFEDCNNAESELSEKIRVRDESETLLHEYISSFCKSYSI